MLILQRILREFFTQGRGRVKISLSTHLMRVAVSEIPRIKIVASAPVWGAPTMRSAPSLYHLPRFPAKAWQDQWHHHFHQGEKWLAQGHS